MIWFLIVAAVLTVAALALLLRPLLHQPRPGVEEAEPVAALFRRQLAAIDEELAEGRIAPRRGRSRAHRDHPAPARRGRPGRGGSRARRRVALGKRRGGSAPRSASPACCRRRRSPSTLPSARPRRSSGMAATRRRNTAQRRRTRRRRRPDQGASAKGAGRSQRLDPARPHLGLARAAFPRRSTPTTMPSPWRPTTPVCTPSSARCWCSKPRAR